MKSILLNILFHIGVVRLWCFIRRNKIIILTLHGVMDPELPSEWNPLRPRTSRKLFDETLKYASKYFNFVSINEAVDMIKGIAPLKKNSCVITFDDGQLNNIKIALPILQKYAVPAIFYPTTGLLSKNEPYWFDRLDYAIQQKGLDGIEIIIGDNAIKIEQSSRKKLALSLSRIIKTLKKEKLSDVQFQSKIKEIYTYMESITGRSLLDLGERDLWSAPMSSSEIQECARISGITIGSHTVNHVRLPFASQEEKNRELEDSKRMLEQLTNTPCLHFCYPNGDWDDESVSAVHEAGYESAVTTDVGSNSVKDNLYTLRRYSFPLVGTPIKALLTITGFLYAVSRSRLM